MVCIIAQVMICLNNKINLLIIFCPIYEQFLHSTTTLDIEEFILFIYIKIEEQLHSFDLPRIPHVEYNIQLPIVLVEHSRNFLSLPGFAADLIYNTQTCYYTYLLSHKVLCFISRLQKQSSICVRLIRSRIIRYLLTSR